MVAEKEIKKLKDPFEKLNADMAAKELNVDVETLKSAMIQGTLPMPLGFYVQHKCRASFVIYRGLLDQLKTMIAGGNISGDNKS